MHIRERILTLGATKVDVSLIQHARKCHVDNWFSCKSAMTSLQTTTDLLYHMFSDRYLSKLIRVVSCQWVDECARSGLQR